MRPASFVLLIIGSGLLLGTALVASVKIPCRVEDFTTTGPDDKPIIRIYSNVWGRPLSAVGTYDVQTDAHQKLVSWTYEEGPYPDGVRQGKWRRVTYKPGKPDVAWDVWFLDGREMSAAEWEQRH